MHEQLLIKNLFNLDETIAADLFQGVDYPWEVLPSIGNFIEELGNMLPEDIYVKKHENIWIAKDAKIASTVSIKGPAIIGRGAELRHCAYIRGKVIIGEKCVVGNSCELKNSILFNRVQVPHFNYVGDSILGYKSHMGAGSITSNVKQDKSMITLRYNGEFIDTNLIKMGAMLGDFVEIGCNSVLNPGTIIGKETHVYPLSMVRGFIPSKSIYKKKGDIVFKK